MKLTGADQDDLRTGDPTRAGEPRACPVCDGHEAQHHRQLDQDADNGRQRRAGVQPEQPDGHGDRELEEV